MVQKVQIPTTTTLTVNGNSISIFTFYNPTVLPNTIKAFISNSVGNDNATPFIENELLIQMINYPQDIDYIIDNDGNLIVLDDTGDTDSYSIDSNGNLLWN